jgi:HEAT repeat protein
MAILPFLQDEDEDVRTAAAESLESLHWPADAASLCEMVRQPSFHRRSLREKRALLSILGRMGTEEGLQILESFLRKKSLFHRQQHEETRRCAELAKGKIKPDSPSGFPGPSGRDSSKRRDQSVSGLAYHSACAGDNRPSDLTGAAPSA